MRFSINSIFKALLIIFVTSTLINMIVKNSLSPISYIIQSSLPIGNIFSPIKELSMLMILLLPFLKNLVNKNYKLNVYLTLTSLFIFFSISASIITIIFSNGNVDILPLGVLTNTIPNSSIRTNEFKLEYFLFFLRWISPVLIAVAYYKSNIVQENKDFIIKLIKYISVIIFIFTIENLLFDTCIQNRCRSIFFTANGLGFNSLSLILVSYKILGLKIFFKKYSFIFYTSLFLLIISLSVTNILALLIFSVPFIIKEKDKYISRCKNYKSLFFLPIVIFLFSKVVNTIKNRGLFDFNSQLYSSSFFTRINIIGNSFNNSDGSLNIFGQKGIYTNIGRIYDGDVGLISDSLIASIIGNFGIIILPFLILTFFILIYNYFLLFKNIFHLRKIDYGSNYLIILTLFISGIGQNILEAQPGAILLGCVIFNQFKET